MNQEPAFTIGIEEEYLLVDRDSLALTEAPDGLIEACAAELGAQVSPEFLRCQIEIGTGICQTVAEAREDLKRLRSSVARHAARFNLAPIAASCHPFSEWSAQHHTRKERYDALERDLAGVARRMVICGMHVHTGIADDQMRIDLTNQFTYFLPHLLALSTSSPFWQGRDTGLASYRLSIFDNLPRTGIPPRFSGWAEYDRTVSALVDLGLIEDSSKIWWDLRPSARFPTVESRICDVQPRLEDTLTLAALTQGLMRMLWRLSLANQRWRIYDSFLIAENRWRAQRYGTTEGLIDFGRREIVPMEVLMQELLGLIEEDCGVLRSGSEAQRVTRMVAQGTSAQRQRSVHARARDSGSSPQEAMQAVVATLVDEFNDGL